MTADSLMAPLDLIRFALAYLIIAAIPGYALAALLRPRAAQIERIAYAIPCAYALVTVSGLITALLHLPFGLLPYAWLAVPVTIIGFHAARRDHKQSNDEIGRWWLAPAGVALLELGALMAVYASDVVPTGWDAAAHAQMINRITQAHVFPIALLSQHLSSNDGGFYPPVFHVLSMLVQDAVPIHTYKIMFFGVLVPLIMMPGALFCYVRMATNRARVGGLAALAALAFEPLPFLALDQGLYALIASFLIVPMLALALHDALGYGDRRAAILSSLLGIALFYTHPTEFITAALLVAAITPHLLRGLRSWIRAGVYGLAIAVTWGLSALPALLAVRHTMVQGAQVEIDARRLFARAGVIHIDAVISNYLLWLFRDNLSYALMLAVIAGIMWSLVRRRFLGLVAVQLVVLVIYVDANTYNLLQRFYVLSFPWAMGYRLIDTEYLFLLPLAAVGLDVILQAGRRYVKRYHAPFRAITAIPILVFGLVLPLYLAAGHGSLYTHLRRVTSAADVHALAWLSHHVSRSTVVVNDEDATHMPAFDVPSDAGLWMPIDGGPQPLFGTGGRGPGDFRARVTVLQHITDRSFSAQVAAFMRHYHVRYVFYGAMVRSNARRHLSLAALLEDHHMRLVYTTASTCTGADRHRDMCPGTAAYVFALDTQPSPAPVVRISHGSVALSRLSSH